MTHAPPCLTDLPALETLANWPVPGPTIAETDHAAFTTSTTAARDRQPVRRRAYRAARHPRSAGAPAAAARAVGRGQAGVPRPSTHRGRRRQGAGNQRDDNARVDQE